MKTEQSPAASEDRLTTDPGPDTEDELVPDEPKEHKQGCLSRARHAVAVFFVQTFRPRTKEDYTELFQRGFKGHKEGIRNKYPWMYIRFLGLCIVLFAIAAGIFYLTGNTLGAPHLLLFGAGMGCIAFLLLIYELYTGNDISLLTLLAVSIIGGFAAVCITQLGYLAYVPEGDWAEPFWVGFWEEFCKALIAILCVLLLKKREPFGAFLIGVAIGCGFALSEDAGYIYVYSTFLTRVTTASSLALERACMAVCTHATWTGIICWAFAKFRKPFINWRFWGCVALSMLMHALWDFPDAGWVNVVATIPVIIAGIVFEVWIIYKCKKPAYVISPGDTEEVQLSINLETGLIGGKSKDSGYYSRAGNLAGSLCLTGASLLLILFFALNPFATRKITLTYTDIEQFISEAQLGHTIDVDINRPYDDTVPIEDNYSYTYTEGQLTAVIQRLPAVIDGVEREDAYIRYCYYFAISSDDETPDEDTDENPDEDTDATPDEGTDENTDPEEGTAADPDAADPGDGEDTEGEDTGDGETEEEEPGPVLPSAADFVYDSTVYTVRKIGDTPFYILNPDYTSWSVNEDATEVYLTVPDENPWYLVGGITLLTLAGCALLGGVISFAACKVKSRRLEKDAQ